MEGDTVKINLLEIKGLHGYINYNINFNEDINFLYGDNGCGKTTVLNILTSIITGQIYKLLNYEFNSIKIQYSSFDQSKTKEIVVTYDNNDKGIILLTFNKNITSIDIHKFSLIGANIQEDAEYKKFFLSHYDVLVKICEEFNYVVLPLNRNGTVNNEYSDYYHLGLKSPISMARHEKSRVSNDLTLEDVKELVKTSYNRITFSLNKLSENFCSNILKSFLDVKYVSDSTQLFDKLNKLNAKDIEKIQQDYISVLKTIKKWNDDTENKVNKFFKSLLNDVEVAQNSREGFSIEILFKLSELIKITNINDEAAKMEQSKEKVYKPIDSFIDTVNAFITEKNIKKKIYIDLNGDLYLKTPHTSKINLRDLSSGEKQIVTFFAYLIFGLQETKQSIFIVDEPEISLHLKWQRQFVESIIKINSNVQLIFATHSPEIIGKYRDKAIKLIPNT